MLKAEQVSSDLGSSEGASTRPNSPEVVEGTGAEPEEDRRKSVKEEHGTGEADEVANVLSLPADCPEKLVLES